MFSYKMFLNFPKKAEGGGGEGVSALPLNPPLRQIQVTRKFVLTQSPVPDQSLKEVTSKG